MTKKLGYLKLGSNLSMARCHQTGILLLGVAVAKPVHVQGIFPLPRLELNPMTDDELLHSLDFRVSLGILRYKELVATQGYFKHVLQRHFYHVIYRYSSQLASLTLDRECHSFDSLFDCCRAQAEAVVDSQSGVTCKAGYGGIILMLVLPT